MAPAVGAMVWVTAVVAKVAAAAACRQNTVHEG